MTFRDSRGLDYKDVLLVPQYSEIESRSKVDISGWLTPNIKLDIPVVSANMDTVTNGAVAANMGLHGAAGIMHRYTSVKQVCDWINDLNQLGVTPIVPSIGVGSEQIYNAKKYIDLGVHAINIDIAHGDSYQMVQTAKALVKCDVDVIAGNICTPEAAKRLLDLGVSAVKVGIGPGASCRTRNNTGAGYPQLSAIMEIIKVVETYNACLIADGGIKETGDIVKALAAGAHTVMSGWLFRGSKEIGTTTYRGMASAEAQQDFKGTFKNVEGASLVVEERGCIKDMLAVIKENIQSGLSYCGANNIDELYENAEFVILKS